MADDWVDVPALAPQPASGDGWADVPAGPENVSGAGHDLVNSTGTGGLMSAFGQGFREASGPEPLGLSMESKKYLSKIGIFAPEGQAHFENPFQAFNEGIMVPAAAALDGVIRTFQGTYRGLQAAGVEAGLPKDIVSLPDAFMGSPHGLGQIKMRSGLPKETPVGKPVAPLSPGPPIDAAFHGSPYSFDAFSSQFIGKGEGSQSFGHGLYFAEEPSVAGRYAELGGEEGNLYQVRINVDQNKLLDLYLPLNKQLPFVQNALKQAMGVDYNGNFDAALSERKWSEHQYADGKTVVRDGFISFSDERVSELLSDAGIPGSKYLDSGSRRAGDGTHNFVVFNENDVQITHKNGEPIPTPQDTLNTARDLGVIGPEKPPITEGTPKEIADRVVSRNADQPPGEKVTQELPGQQDAWQQRFDGFVSKLDAPADVQQLIRDAAKENGDFLPARQGEIPLSHVTYRGLQAAGVEAGLPNDIVSLPDAFMGSPGGLGKITTRPGLPKEGVRAPQVAERVPVTADDLRNGRAKGETDYHMSPKAMMEPEPYHAFHDMARDLPEDVNSEFQVHGLLAGARDENLINLLENGIDPNREFHSGSPRGGSHGVDSTRTYGAPYLLISERGESLRDTGVKNVVAVGPAEANIPALKAAYPDVNFMTVPEAESFMTGQPVTQELPGQQDAWQQRFDGFVSKLDAPADVQQLIRDAAKENGDFLPARQGEIPLSHVEGIADAAGVAADEINARGLGRKLQNDGEVRVAMRLMLQVTEDVTDAARNVRMDASPENLIKLQENIMRRDLAVEQVVGLRAEWGRTGKVIQEFMRDVKDQQGLSDFLKKNGMGRSPKSLTEIADTIAGMNDPSAKARLLNDLRAPDAWDKFKYYWVNALISGPVTHAKYIVANAAFAAYESAVVTPAAGVVGTVRRAATGSLEGVYMGEAAARMYGIVASVPDAMQAAIQAAKTGLQTPLPGEIAQNIIPKRNKNLAYQQVPIEGALGKIIGAPSRGASAIHSFFNFMGYRASIEAQAYRQAAKEGLKPADDAFWQRRASAADRPTPEMMSDAIEEGYKLTYISELGETGRKLSAFVNSTKVGQLIMPFTHIPLNILKRAIEGTPAAFLDAETREALSGAKGAVKQDTAIARMVVGGAVGTWAMNLVLNDRMTGFGPTDPKERAQWLATGHQPYSIRIGDYWYSANRFGSLGTMLGLYSNLAEVIPHLKPDAEELTKAIGMTVHSTGRLMEDEVGMQGLAGLMEAINEPDRKGAKFVSNFAGSLLPYSSMQRQIASSMDPYMRETKSVVDGLRYYIPNQRQGLLLKRDWSGMPIANAGYGGDTAVPGVSSVIQHRYAVPDPVALEMTALDLHPAPPQNRIGGVKLPPTMYDTYQSTAGPLTREALTQYINTPGWHDIPMSARQEIFKGTIKAARQQAGAAMQMRYPELITQGVADRVARINGQKPTKLKE